MSTKAGKDLPIWLYFWIPFLIYSLSYFFQSYQAGIYIEAWYKEMGILESLTIIFLIIAVLLGLAASKKLFALMPKLKPQSWLTKIFPWLILAIVIACLYFGGEEASWGQHLFKWKAPEAWNSFNYKAETNLHNSSNHICNVLFNKLPRLVLTILAIVGGIISPLVIKFKKIKLDTKSIYYWLLPTIVCLPACAFTIASSIPKLLAKYLDFELPNALNILSQEPKECLLALFLMLYLSSLYVRLKNPQS